MKKQKVENSTKKKGFFKKSLALALVAGTLAVSSVGLVGCSDGKDGENGATWFSGQDTPFESTGKIGDFYFDTDDYNIYQKGHQGWVIISNIKGETGATGSTGETGPQGPQGETGEIGEIGPQGPQGEAGADGSSWITGTTAPTSNTGKNGDTYLDVTTNYIYTKTDGTWNKIGELSGDRDITIQQNASPWTGKTAVFVGDSITYGSGCDGDKYWQVLEDELGLAQVIGMGVGGSCFSTTSDYGHNNQPLMDRYKTIPEADLIQIFMGTNDYGHGTPLGTIEDSTDVSFYGALNVILPYLQEKYPSSRIVVCTPLHRYGRNASANVLTYDYLPHPVTGNTLQDYVDALKEVCQRYSIPVIDLFNISGINPTIEAVRNRYIPDGLHPNTDGHKIMANIMKYHLNLYATTEEKEIVSTDYEYEIKYGNLFSTDSSTQSNTTRATAVRNLYLKKDTVVSVKDTSRYNIAIYSQTGETINASSSISGFVDSYTILENGWYGFVLSQDDGAAFNFPTMSKEFYDYVSIVGTEPEASLVTGNKFGTGATLTDSTRATASKNIYLSAGTKIAIIDSSVFKMAVYAQTGETIESSSSITGGYVTEYTVSSAGWYGIVISQENSFNFATDSADLYDYVTITEPEVQLTLVTGNKFGTGATLTDTTRATTSKNIYLSANTIITVKDSSVYKIAVYAQTSEDIVTATNISGGYVTEFKITTDGWYGFVISNTSSFDFSTSSVDFYSYVAVGEFETVDLTAVSVETGSKFAANYESVANRASTDKNLYLEVGTIVTLKDSSTYAMAIYAQTGETNITTGTSITNGWNDTTFVITEAGWYGIAFKRVDNANFDFVNTDSTKLEEYVTVLKESES
ncbi:MAG: hypothetical protein IKC11_01500 [Clostridia bacterium]|nr:hypothetical protein [Clostridia bacterium]